MFVGASDGLLIAFTLVVHSQGRMKILKLTLIRYNRRSGEEAPSDEETAGDRAEDKKEGEEEDTQVENLEDTYLFALTSSW